jgi:hypothetical protein
MSGGTHSRQEGEEVVAIACKCKDASCMSNQSGQFHKIGSCTTGEGRTALWLTPLLAGSVAETNLRGGGVWEKAGAANSARSRRAAIDVRIAPACEGKEGPAHHKKGAQPPDQL